MHLRSDTIAKSRIESWTSRGDCTPYLDTRNHEITPTVGSGVTGGEDLEAIGIFLTQGELR
jgi:hypothetical protein